MTAFHYQAIDTRGKRHKGVMEADSARQVRQQLREATLTPLAVHRVKVQSMARSARIREWFTPRLRIRDLALLTRQLATLLNAKIPIDQALMTVAEQTEKQAVKSIILGVRSKVTEGHTLAVAMHYFPKAFPLIYRATIACGEKSSQLDHILLKLAEFVEHQEAVHRKIQQATIYPLMMLLVSIAVVTFLLTYIVPKIMEVFVQTEQALPVATKILLAISNTVKQAGWYILSILILLTA